MKSHTPLITLIAALLCTAGIPALAKSENTHPMMFDVDQIVRDGSPMVKVGSADSTVWYHLGSPDARPAKNVWVYHNFRGLNDRATSHACRSVMLSFADNRVTRIVLVNDKADRVITAQLQANPDYLTQDRLVAQR